MKEFDMIGVPIRKKKERGRQSTLCWSSQRRGKFTLAMHAILARGSINMAKQGLKGLGHAVLGYFFLFC